MGTFEWTIEAVRNHLATLPDDGSDTIPSEGSLASELGMSRDRVRRALLHLAMIGELHPLRNRGYVKRVRVVDSRIRKMCSYTKRLLASREKPKTRLLELTLSEAPEHIAEDLSIGSETPTWYLRVVRYRGTHPITLAEQWIPESAAPNLAAVYGEGLSTHSVLSVVFGIQPVRARSVVTATAADYEAAHHLEVPLHYPLLRVESINTDQNGRAVEVSNSLFRSDMYRLSVTPPEEEVPTLRP
ncbi:MAG: GntR family transcriptional regulator [Spirochaetota bacterium]